MPITQAAREDPLFDALISTAVDGIVVIDEDSIVRVYNKACERLFGYRTDEVLGKNISMLMPLPYREAHDAYVGHYLKTGERHIIGIGREVSGRRKDGSTFPMYLSVGEGHVLNQRIFVGIITDLSEHQARDKRIQELQLEMWQLGRLTDMGQIAAGLAHELNQPLTAILNYTNAGRDIAAESGDKELERIFAKVAEQTSRAGAIIKRLRSFIEKREPHRVPEDLGRVIEDSIRLGMTDAAERGVDLELDIATGLPKAMIDRIQIQQVLVNLMKNAAEAMEDSPRRLITVGTATVGEDLLQVSVADTGPGIENEIADKLFQAFVTSKRNGMGMGLNICRSIVESHGGRLWAEANPGGGTVFRFNLPIAKDEPVA
ncbi:MAG: PAS domain S-box protein [Alphaproteobacteria bacterium]|nr:PAS domain S-box protein [Alphaproteobacteria bacterium]MBL6937726.1 PAS domain S-box protein [Alphaproteobacteria bacterium]MBL7099064.1 PAS domain S-box protein [Alphaproteobacteria bacterium]